MIRVERANVVLYVEQEDIQHYINLGYNVTDESGKIIEKAIPNDLGTLQRAYVENAQKIKVLEDEVSRLTAELSMRDSAKTKKSAKQE